MRKLSATRWIIPIAIAFLANFIFFNVYLPFRGMPPIGIEVQASKGSVIIWSVEAGSPAADAGALPGDKVRSFNGTPVRELNDYLMPEELISQKDRTVMSVERDGKQLALELKITGTNLESLSDVNRFALFFWILIGGLELAFALFLALARPHDGSALSAS